MNAPAAFPQDRLLSTPEPSTTLARLLERIPETVRDSFTAEQLLALEGALDTDHAKSHPVNIRVSLLDWAYFTILGGREARNPERRNEERKRHPLSSPGNIAFLTVVSLVGLTLGATLNWLLFGG